MSNAIRSVRAFKRQKDIFCVEGAWEPDYRDKKSVENVLEFVEIVEKVKFITRKCYNKDTLFTLLKDSAQKRYKNYSILYLAFPGEPNHIHLGKRNKKVSLDEIADMIDGTANGKIIHFGACSTLNISQWVMRNFLKKTAALAISGYQKDIGFLESTAMDLLYFQQCQKTVDITSIKQNTFYYYSRLAKELGFVLKYW